MSLLFRIPLRPVSNSDFFSRPFLSEDFFQLTLKVDAFKPEEISIKLTEDNIIIVEGKQDEKKKDHGSISRYFVEKCVIPSGYDVSKIQSVLHLNGLLTIWAPKLKSDDGKNDGTNIPIVRVKGERFSSKSKL